MPNMMKAMAITSLVVNGLLNSLVAWIKMITGIAPTKAAPIRKIEVLSKYRLA